MISLLGLIFAAEMAYVQIFRAEDTKITAGRWFINHAPVGSIIGKIAYEGDHRVVLDSNHYQIVYSQPHKERLEIQVIDERSFPQPDFIIVTDFLRHRNQFNMQSYKLVETIQQPLQAFGLGFNDQFSPDDDMAPRWYDKFHATVSIYQRSE